MLVLESGKAVHSSHAFTMTLPWPLDAPDKLEVRLPSPAQAASSLAWLMEGSPTLLGVDVETDALNEVQLVQLSTATRAVLLRWSGLAKGQGRPGFLALCALMADPGVLKVGCELRKDALDMLYDSRLMVRMCGGRDVTPALLRPGKSGERGFVYGLVEAFNLRHGTELVKDKNVTCSDWSRASLTLEQLEYAALDAYMSYRLGCDPKLMSHGEVRYIEIKEVHGALADAGRLLRESQLQMDAARQPVASGFSETVWLAGVSEALQVRMTHYETKLRTLDRVEVVFADSPPDLPWAAVAAHVKGRTAVLKSDPRERKERDGTPKPSLELALALSPSARPAVVKSITIVDRDDLLAKIAYDESACARVCGMPGALVSHTLTPSAFVLQSKNWLRPAQPLDSRPRT